MEHVKLDLMGAGLSGGYIAMNKICTECKEELPATLEYFNIDRKGQLGFQSKCRTCRNEADRKYKIKNKEKIAKYKYQYNQRNKKELTTYRNTHRWIYRRKPKQNYCSICNEVKKVELANISGNYKRDIEDYFWLCIRCHHLFDRVRKEVYLF